MSVTVRYFASLRDAAGVAEETVPVPASLPALYEALQARHGFAIGRERLRVAMDGHFVEWNAPVADGAEVVFIPPVSGG